MKRFLLSLTLLLSFLGIGFAPANAAPSRSWFLTDHVNCDSSGTPWYGYTQVRFKGHVTFTVANGAGLKRQRHRFSSDWRSIHVPYAENVIGYHFTTTAHPTRSTSVYAKAVLLSARCGVLN